MHCLTCARTGAVEVAVATCPHCSAGLCLTHVEETASRRGPGGMRLSCGHDTWTPLGTEPASTVQGRRPQESSISPSH